MIVIIDYGLGNLRSVKNALTKIGVRSVISSSIAEITKASGLILPGVGAAGEGMKNLKSRQLDKIITQETKKGKPILGICLGMQLLMNKSEENNTECLGVVNGTVKKFTVQLKVPQIGWNAVQFEAGNPLFKNILQDSYFYFVHSYYCIPEKQKLVIGKTNYETNFCSALQRKNIYGVQFHPEKSGRDGLQLLENFTKNVYGNNSSD